MRQAHHRTKLLQHLQGEPMAQSISVARFDFDSTKMASLCG